MRAYTIKIFFNDGTQLEVDCDDFVICDNSHYAVVKDGMRVMSIPFGSAKYTVTVSNEGLLEERDQVLTQLLCELQELKGIGKGE